MDVGSSRVKPRFYHERLILFYGVLELLFKGINLYDLRCSALDQLHLFIDIFFQSYSTIFISSSLLSLSKYRYAFIPAKNEDLAGL